MTLNLHNTKTRSIETFTSITPHEVTMYACGPTVYDKTHIGHMRKYIGDDILRRTLSLLGYTVKHVMNITDVGHLTGDETETGEDKLEKGAHKEGKTVWDIAKYYTEYFHETMQAVNVLPPNIEPKATDHVEEMIALTETLLAKGFAYETDQAIYFDTEKDPQYGSLSGQKLADKRTGARDDVVEDPNKKNPADFSLWFKRTGKFAQHTMYWQSPWGDGFPGWHIECSAMAMHYLGETIDIHTGGIDHIPVHHENEIAQSECATGHTFVHYWVHHDFLTVDGQKMSKSKENFYTIEDIKARAIDPLAVRIMCMQTHYRKPLNFTWESLTAAEVSLKKIRGYANIEGGSIIESYITDFTVALEDDLNTAKALSVVYAVINDETVSREDKSATLRHMDTVLGLGLSDIVEEVIPEHIIDLAEERKRARDNKDWSESDRLRDVIANQGYQVKDTSEGYEITK